MKRVYQKPDIVFEVFSLSVNIAGGCEIISLQSPGTCGLNVKDDFGFLSDTVIFNNSGCNTTAPEGNIYDGICYDVPSQDNNMFSS